jgi:hypothetical protein
LFKNVPFLVRFLSKSPQLLILYAKNYIIIWSIYLFIFTFVQNSLIAITMNNPAHKAHSIKPYWDVEGDADEMQPALKPYTMEEINAMIDYAEREMAAGLGQDSEEMFRELEAMWV